MPPRFRKPCSKCGELFNTGGSLCPACRAVYNQKKEADENRRVKKAFLYGGDYRKKAKAVRDSATICFMCGGVFTLDDPPQADHVDPTLGHRSPLVPMHGRCNRDKGNKPFNGNPDTTRR
jgi:hypothetical protein